MGLWYTVKLAQMSLQLPYLGIPIVFDRILGTRFGVKAVQLIQDGKFGTMVSYQNYQTLDVPISHAVHRLRRVDPGGQMVQTARAVEISFGD